MPSSRLTVRIVLGLTLAIQAACGPRLAVRTDWDPARVHAIETWQTFAWLDHTDEGQPYEDLDDARIRDALAAGLTARGFQLVPDDGAADFLVAHHLSVRTQYTVHSPPYYGGFGWHDPWWPRYGGGRAYVSEWHTGVLVVDVVDAATYRLAWRGVAESPPLGRSTDPARRQVLIQQAVDEMLSEFPIAREALAPAVSLR